jgi:hypothetical protein
VKQLHASGPTGLPAVCAELFDSTRSAMILLNELRCSEAAAQCKDMRACMALRVWTGGAPLTAGSGTVQQSILVVGA